MTDDERLLAAATGHCATGVATVILSAAGIKDDDLALICGVPRSTVWRWRTGRIPPRGPKGLEFARRLMAAIPSAPSNLDREEEVAGEMLHRARQYARAVRLTRKLIATGRRDLP